ncbi:MAG: class I SAM-dependent methyltransferase [Planctomycetota bacterium]
MNPLDDPARESEISDIIRRKVSLRLLYEETYERYRSTLAQCPTDGIAIELGAGAGFVRDVIPEMLTADVLPYRSVDLVFDATRMPFADESLRFIGMLNVLHHIPDVASFLSECQRCLKPGGRMLIVDQYPGLLSKWIYRCLHHEPWNPDASDWSFPSGGPLSGANGALAWIVFFRDRQLFEQKFPDLRIHRITPHTPLRYWLSGGLKRWNLIPRLLWKPACLIDRWMMTCTRQFGSFMDVELVRAHEYSSTAQNGAAEP